MLQWYKEKYRVSCLHNEKMIILWLLSSQNRYKWPINVVIMCNFRKWKGQIDHLCLLYNLKHPWCQSSIITIKEETFNCFPGRKFNYGWAQQVSTHISVCVCVCVNVFILNFHHKLSHSFVITSRLVSFFIQVMQKTDVSKHVIRWDK